MTLRAAVIGCGRIGSRFADDPGLAGDVYSHAQAYRLCPATELVALCDADRATLEECGQRWGVTELFTDAGAMLAATAPDLVSICTPDATHFELARLAIASRGIRGLLCEKPLALTVDEGEQLIALAAERGVSLAVAFVRRYASNMQALARMLRAGDLGAVKAVGGWYGKGTAHNGSHWFDLLAMLVGQVAWVEAANRLGEGGDDPTLDVSLGLSGSQVVATLRGTDCSLYSVFEMDLLCERGRVIIRDGGHSIELYSAASSQRYAGYTELARVDTELGDQRNMMLRAVEDLAAAVIEQRQPLSSGTIGLAALLIAEAACKATATGGRVEIPKFAQTDGDGSQTPT